MFRNGDRVDPAVIGTQKAALFGLGSGGSYLAQLLPGPLQKIYYVDDELLEDQNIERHRVGRYGLGQPKAAITRAEVLRHYGYPDDSIEAVIAKGQAVLGQFDRVNLLLDATANPSFQSLLNQWGVKHNIPMIFLGVHEGGLSWRVLVFPKPAEVCYNCYCLETYQPQPEQQEMPANYGVELPLDSSEGLQAATGLVSAVAATAAYAARMATEILMGREVATHSYREVHQPYPVANLSAEQVKPAGLMVQLLQRFGINQLSVMEQPEGFTLQQNGGSIPYNIQRSAGCWLHQA